MTMKEKWLAMKALGFPVISMTDSGKFIFCIPGVEVKKGPVLSGFSGPAETVERAVDIAWDNLTKIKAGERVIINAQGLKRQEVTWSGFMWKEFVG